MLWQKEGTCHGCSYEMTALPCPGQKDTGQSLTGIRDPLESSLTSHSCTTWMVTCPGKDTTDNRGKRPDKGQ